MRNSSRSLVLSSFYKRHSLPNPQIKGLDFVGCCVKLLHCRARVLPALREAAFTDKRMRILRRMRQGFYTSVGSLGLVTVAPMLCCMYSTHTYMYVHVGHREQCLNQVPSPRGNQWVRRSLPIGLTVTGGWWRRWPWDRGCLKVQEHTIHTLSTHSSVISTHWDFSDMIGTIEYMYMYVVCREMVRICLYVYVCVAPPMIVGAWSMAIVLYMAALWVLLLNVKW